MPAFSYEINKDGIAIVTFDLPGEKANKLTTPVMEELDRLLDELAARKEIKGLVFRSGKEAMFIAGADIAEIRDINDASTGEQLARKGQAIFSKLEALPFPTVAAIHGPCMGGGLELALACTWRVVSNDPKTALALPEVKLGILPGFGGTQRLPKIIGLIHALDMILTGRAVHARKAGAIGLADEVTYKEILLQRAVAIAGKPGEKTKTRGRRSFLNRLLESNFATRVLIFRTARQRVLAETQGNYPAPLAALEAVRYGFSHSSEQGYRHEAELLGQLVPTAVSKNLISVFYLGEMLKKDSQPSLFKADHAGVIGAGVMGGGIAQLFAEKGITVRMKDVTSKAVGAGLREAWQIFSKRRKKGILTPVEARDGFDRITGTTDYRGFENAELAVEAVVENMEIKKSVLREFEAVAGEKALFASNTSSLSITELAAASLRPAQVAGLHFFNPVEKMPLVEVVRGNRTSDETIAALAALSRKMGKLPVVVNDGPGFLVNRILMPYLGEAVAMLEEGADIEEIDQALLQFGMPMGAFILLDEIGIDISHKVSGILHAGLGERAKPSGLLGTLFKDGYLGKKNAKGFYRYEEKKRTRPDTSVYGKIPARSGHRIAQEEIVDRAVLLMIKEAALCLEENIVHRPDLVDAALIFGIGFPAFRGGLLKYADAIGIETVVDKLEGYTGKYGHRFRPPHSLIQMAVATKKFYG